MWLFPLLLGVGVGVASYGHFAAIACQFLAFFIVLDVEVSPLKTLSVDFRCVRSDKHSFPAAIGLVSSFFLQCFEFFVSVSEILVLGFVCVGFLTATQLLLS